LDWTGVATATPSLNIGMSMMLWVCSQIHPIYFQQF
jgi:hypothetical protein